ncbi:MAG: hypothetical protein ACLFUU_13525, partial [Desulfobacteraceae bacterium]
FLTGGLERAGLGHQVEASSMAHKFQMDPHWPARRPVSWAAREMKIAVKSKQCTTESPAPKRLHLLSWLFFRTVFILVI